jgi:hypothetical protein
MFANPPCPCHAGRGRNSSISPPLPFLAHSSLTGQHHGLLPTPHTYLSHIFQPLITVWPTITFFTCPSFSTLIRHRICSFLYPIPTFPTHLPTYLLTHTPHLGHPHPPANTYLQTRTRENVPLEIFATARDSFPFVASTAPGQDPLVAVLLFSSCRIRALSSPRRWMRQ